jgi:hypothetical protein
MKLLTLSFALILTVSDLALSEPSPRADESKSLEPEKSSAPSLSTKEEIGKPPTPRVEQKGQTKKKGDKTNKRSVSVSQSASNPQKDSPSNKPEQSFSDYIRNGFIPSTWASWGQVIVAAFGLLIIWLTLGAVKTQANATLKTAESLINTERAYVKITHSSPGLVLSDPPGICGVNMEVRNLGNTPTRITQISLEHIILPQAQLLTTEPNYHPRENIEEVFLFKGDPFYFPYRIPLADIDRENMERGDSIFYLYGYIDYIDQFGQRHRSGYGRRFRQHDTDNLIFIVQEGYNYDRHRNPGEGRDWPESDWTMA